MDFGVVSVRRDLQTCLQEQANGIQATNMCRIGGDFNKCPAGSTMDYGGDVQTIDAKILCPLDSVQQSEWLEASQKGLCGCESQLRDQDCALLPDEMECECFACPFGMTVGFAYSCTTEIVGPCKSFDCSGRCNYKYDPANLVGGRETFAPSNLDNPTEEIDESSSASKNDMLNNHVVGTAIMAVALFRMIF